MAVLPFYVPKFRAFDSNGDPLAGGLLYTYAAGTTTPLLTYTTRAGDVANANPVVLDANGEADVWTTPSVDYKFVLKDSAGVTQWTVDNVPSLPDVSIIPLELGDGTVAAPALSFINDPDCGLYRIGSEIVGMAANGAERQRWTASGTTITALNVTGDASVGGTLSLTGGDPASSTAHTNEIASTSIVKAWAAIDFAANSATIAAGFNVSAAAATSTGVEVTLASAMSGTTYLVLASSNDSSLHCVGSSSGATTARILCRDLLNANAVVDFTTTVLTGRLFFLVLGAQ